MEHLPHTTQSDTILALVKKSQRHKDVAIRRVFLQQRNGSATVPGPLHHFVQNHDERGLDLYLLVRLIAVHAPYKAVLEAGVWARALGLPATLSAHQRVSRIWKRLVDLDLITRERERRNVAVTLLREDGSGSPYTRPTGQKQAEEQYLRIPLIYWEDEWYRRLDLPAKAMLLIALNRRPGFSLPSEKAPEWYGISADTVERGFARLKAEGAVDSRDGFKKAPLTGQGWTKENHYTLKAPFDRSRHGPAPPSRADPTDGR